MKLKLTTAQQELYSNYQLNGAKLDGNTLTIHNVEVFREHLTILREFLQEQRYTPTQGRERFAAIYLQTKFEKTLANPESAPTSQPVDLTTLLKDTTVYLIGDSDQTFRYVYTNRDGSLHLYGGTTHYKMFRDIHADRLTITRPKSMPKPRDTSVVE